MMQNPIFNALHLLARSQFIPVLLCNKHLRTFVILDGWLVCFSLFIQCIFSLFPFVRAYVFVWCILLRFYWISSSLRFKSHIKRVLKVRNWWHTILQMTRAKKNMIHAHGYAYIPKKEEEEDQEKEQKIIYRQIETHN